MSNSDIMQHRFFSGCSDYALISTESTVLPARWHWLSTYFGLLARVVHGNGNEISANYLSPVRTIIMYPSSSLMKKP